MAANADGIAIPIVEGDQGEGIKDPLDMDEYMKMCKQALYKADQNFQSAMIKNMKCFEKQRR